MRTESPAHMGGSKPDRFTCAWSLVRCVSWEVCSTASRPLLIATAGPDQAQPPRPTDRVRQSRPPSSATSTASPPRSSPATTRIERWQRAARHVPREQPEREPSLTFPSSLRSCECARTEPGCRVRHANGHPERAQRAEALALLHQPERPTPDDSAPTASSSSSVLLSPQELPAV